MFSSQFRGKMKGFKLTPVLWYSEHNPWCVKINLIYYLARNVLRSVSFQSVDYVFSNLCSYLGVGRNSSVMMVGLVVVEGSTHTQQTGFSEAELPWLIKCCPWCSEGAALCGAVSASSHSTSLGSSTPSCGTALKIQLATASSWWEIVHHRQKWVLVRQNLLKVWSRVERLNNKMRIKMYVDILSYFGITYFVKGEGCSSYMTINRKDNFQVCLMSHTQQNLSLFK